MTRVVTILDMQTNAYVPSGALLAQQPSKVAEALKKAIHQIETTGHLSGPTIQGRGPGKWIIEVSNADNVLTQFYVQYAEAAAAIPPAEAKSPPSSTPYAGQLHMVHREYENNPHDMSIEDVEYHAPAQIAATLNPPLRDLFLQAVEDFVHGVPSVDYSVFHTDMAKEHGVSFHISRPEQHLDFRAEAIWVPSIQHHSSRAR